MPNGKILFGFSEAQAVIENWRTHYNTKRPHYSLDYRPRARVTVTPKPLPLDEMPDMQ
ncbi:MAG: transposase [Alphaproteobacteria bacterium]|nr:transposase [Alphaproteobacteria bacterium]